MLRIELNWQCWQLNCNELKSAMPAIGNVVGNWQCNGELAIRAIDLMLAQ
jgi:hypothetical protein